MYYWLIISLASVLILFIFAIFYALHFHLLLRETILHPKLHKQLGSPNGIGDYSLRHNFECYDAINKYFKEQRYLQLDDDRLRQRFINHQKWKQRGKFFAFAVVINMCICIVAIILL